MWCEVTCGEMTTQTPHGLLHALAFSIFRSAFNLILFLSSNPSATHRYPHSPLEIMTSSRRQYQLFGSCKTISAAEAMTTFITFNVHCSLPVAFGYLVNDIIYEWGLSCLLSKVLRFECACLSCFQVQTTWFCRDSNSCSTTERNLDVRCGSEINTC